MKQKKSIRDFKTHKKKQKHVFVNVMKRERKKNRKKINDLFTQQKMKRD